VSSPDPHLDRIEVRALRIVATHGVLPEERERAQPFELDLDISVDTTPAGASDRLSDTMDYGAAVERVAALVRETSFLLLEALAGAVAQAVLDLDQRVDQVAVVVRKLRPPIEEDVGSVGVRVVRRRAEEGASAP
jgi:dihydroneopterin aldolase